MGYKTIILDFDGTIVESVGIKDEAFEELFQDYPSYLGDIKEYHLAYNATIRFDKFKHIYENILGEKYSPSVEESLSKKFSEIVYSKIVACPYVEGAVDFLEFFWKRVPIYLASVNPADELDRILKARKIINYFKGIYAYPWVKAAAINDVIQKEKITPAEAVFIGDTLEDYISARDAGVCFIGRRSGRSFGGASIPIYKDLKEIQSFLRNTLVPRQV